MQTHTWGQEQMTACLQVSTPPAHASQGTHTHVDIDIHVYPRIQAAPRDTSCWEPVSLPRGPCRHPHGLGAAPAPQRASAGEKASGWGSLRSKGSSSDRGLLSKDSEGSLGNF